MERSEAIEIPFGAFDSELKGWEYTIPEGMEAEIKDGKIIVREKESEDEKIRKALIQHIKYKVSVILGWRKEELIAWLEKQGEQNLANSAKTCKDEQKPAELPKGEDYGIDGLYAAIDILQKTIGKVDGYQTDDGILEHECAINAVKELYEQNPAWSEEDEYVYNEILKRVADKKLYKHDLEYIYNWLKALKERVQPEQDLHPRYIEGKGIYVPIIDVVLNMQDEPEEMTWDKAKNIALSKEQMFVVLYHKDEINALLEKHGGQKLEGWHWTSTQSSGATNAWYVYFNYSSVRSHPRTSGLSVRAFSAYRPESYIFKKLKG